MIIPIIALIVLIVCIGIFVVITFGVTWHLFKFGVHGDASNAMAVIFLVVAIILIVLSVITYGQIRWEAFSSTF